MIAATFVENGLLSPDDFIEPLFRHGLLETLVEF